MARQPEVFVRALEPAEAQRLVKITRTARDRLRLRRAGIVLASVQGRSAAGVHQRVTGPTTSPALAPGSRTPPRAELRCCTRLEPAAAYT